MIEIKGGQAVGEGAGEINRLIHQLRTGADNDLAVADTGLVLPDRDALEDRIATFLAGGEGGVPAALRGEIEAILRLIYEGEALSGPPGFGTTEMVVVPDGSRPIFFIQNGVLVKGAGNGTFVDLITANAGVLGTAARAVGRIESDIRPAPPGVDKWFAGTGFLVAPDLIMTNRHVLQLLVNEPHSGPGPFTLNGKFWINFDAEFGSSARRRFRLDQVLYAGPQSIDGLDLGRLDMALIRLGAPETGAEDQAPPLKVSLQAPSVGQPLYAIGYPSKPRITVGDVELNSEIEQVLISLFDKRFGGKRCASGEVDALPGHFDEDVKRWTVQHDVSTLNGNSGSPLLTVTGSDVEVMAIHFGGRSRVGNYGHVFDQLVADLRTHGVPV